MREFLELRLSAEEAALYVPGYATKGLDPLDTVRLHRDVNDPLVEKLRSIEAGYQAQGTTLFSMCAVRRHYTPRELQAAEHLKVEFWPFFMPSGEECGTQYEDARACPLCGAGAPQLGELRLNVGRIPKSRDLAVTPGAEFVVSSRLVKAMRAHRITGFELRPVLSKGGKPTEAWHQLIIPSATVEAAPLARFGKSYLAPEPDETRCPRGHVLGRRLLSPLHVARSSLKALDWQALRGLLGARQGLFRPHPLFIISQRLYRLLKKLKVRNLNEEVAHVV
ncbi:hypothetical protein [Stigmatella hybrida]|uniref:hypothetical protein n=1 Tax=Stigmatella hybrida TaxID=394097 RepID=UPI001CDAAA90|nr:hypothetical protein [Stigmatella hybrida]